MLKVLFYIPTLGGGGAERVLVNLVNRLDKTKYDITVLTLFNVGKYRDFLDSDITYRYNFKKIFKGNAKILRLFPKKFLFKKFVKDKYDVIVAYLESPVTRIVAGCTDSDTKLISWTHTEMRNEKDILTSFRSKKERLDCYNRFDKNVFVSETAMNSAKKFMELENCLVKYNTVESDKIHTESLEPIEDLTFSNDFVNLISVGRLVEQKGFSRLLNIQKKLIDEGFKIRLYILGDGYLRKDLESFIAENNLSNYTFLLGFKENPYKYVKNADLFVCSSLREGYSTAVTESLIVGTPVITTRCSGMDELLENGKYGFITENGDDALYDGLKKVLSDENLLKNLKRAATNRGQFFSAEDTVKSVEELLDNIGS